MTAVTLPQLNTKLPQLWSTTLLVLLALFLLFPLASHLLQSATFTSICDSITPQTGFAAGLAHRNLLGVRCYDWCPGLLALEQTTGTMWLAAMKQFILKHCRTRQQAAYCNARLLCQAKVA